MEMFDLRHGVLLILILISGCVISSKGAIKLENEIVPSKVSLEEPEPLQVTSKITNIGEEVETVTADILKTEGLDVSKPDKTTFTIKPGESRIVTFNATLTEDAVPGDYIVDVNVTTAGGKTFSGVAKLKVVREKGLI